MAKTRIAIVADGKASGGERVAPPTASAIPGDIPGARPGAAGRDTVGATDPKRTTAATRGGSQYGRGGYGRERQEDWRDRSRGYTEGYGSESGRPGGSGYASRPDYGRDQGRGYEDRGYGGRENERGWFDRATDEVSSWFGDKDAERRRREDERGEHRGRGPRGYTRSDERIREDVNDRLTDHPGIDASDIEVQASQGEVTLSGTVDSRYAKRMAEDVADGVSGVSHVQNNLRVRQFARERQVASGGTPSVTSSAGVLGDAATGGTSEVPSPSTSGRALGGETTSGTSGASSTTGAGIGSAGPAGIKT